MGQSARLSGSCGSGHAGFLTIGIAQSQPGGEYGVSGCVISGCSVSRCDVSGCDVSKCDISGLVVMSVGVISVVTVGVRSVMSETLAANTGIFPISNPMH